MKLAGYRQRIEKLKFVVIGDLILDHYLKGIVTRLSPEAPVPILEVNGGFYRLGGAANVAANLAALGAETRLVGVIGDDFEGARLAKMADEQGITPFFVKDKERRTTRKTRCISVSQQICRLDYEDRSPVPHKVCDEIIGLVKTARDGVDAVVVADYAKGVMCQRLLLFLEDNIVGFIPTFYSPKPPLPLELRGAGVVLANRKEAETLAGKPDLTDVQLVTELQKSFSSESAVVTLGERGLIGFAHGKTFKVKAAKRQVFDVSGAGDTVLSLYAAGRVIGLPHEVCGYIASAGAGFVLQEIGTCPVTWKQMKEVKW